MPSIKSSQCRHDIQSFCASKCIRRLRSGLSAASRVPLEVWMIVFEFLTRDDWSLHLFDQSYFYRHTSNRHTRAIHLVCQKWRDAATMMRCLNYRVPTFGYLTQHDDGTMIEVDRFERFAERMVVKTSAKSGGRPYVETLYIQRIKRYETPRNQADTKLGKALQSLLPMLGHLTEFACHMFMSIGEFDTLTAITSHSLRKLAIDFDYRLPSALHLFNRLEKLEDLSLSIIQQLNLRATRDRPILPALRRLEINASRWDMDYALNWLSRLETRVGLRTLRLSGDFTDGRAIRTFLNRQGQNIHTLGIYDRKFQGHFGPWNVPSIITMEIGMRNANLDIFLATMPTQIRQLVLWKAHDPMSLKCMMHCIRKAAGPRDSHTALRTAMIARHFKQLNSRNLGWAEYFTDPFPAGMKEVELNECIFLARRMHRTGVQVVDEDGVPLLEFLHSLEKAALPQPWIE